MTAIIAAQDILSGYGGSETEAEATRHRESY